MKIENGKYIYTVPVHYLQYDGQMIRPVSVEFAITTSCPVYISETITIPVWLEQLFDSKLVLPASFNAESNAIFSVKEFIGDFLFVERVEYEYIATMLYTILNNLTDNKIESLTYTNC